VKPVAGRCRLPHLRQLSSGRLACCRRRGDGTSELRLLSVAGILRSATEHSLLPSRFTYLLLQDESDGLFVITRPCDALTHTEIDVKVPDASADADQGQQRVRFARVTMEGLSCHES
jgi:hypothetical protein